MTGKRTRYTAEFKAKVALEALRGELTVAQRHGVSPSLVCRWRRQAEGRAVRKAAPRPPGFVRLLVE